MNSPSLFRHFSLRVIWRETMRQLRTAKRTGNAKHVQALTNKMNWLIENRRYF